MTKTLRAWAIIGLLAMPVADGLAQRLAGVVTDSSGRPIPEVRVELRGSARMTTTDANGRYELSAKSPGMNVVQMRRLGFAPRVISMELDPDSTKRLDVTLRVVPKMLDAQVIAETAPDRSLAENGFYGRMLDAKKGLVNGSFITPEQLDLRKPPRITQILGDLPGVRIAGGRRGSGIIMSSRGNCAMAVYVDGARAESGGMARGAAVTSIWGGAQASKGGDGGTGWSIDDEIPASDVVAIEVYPLAVSAPARFQLLNGTCGIVAIWTKH